MYAEADHNRHTRVSLGLLVALGNNRRVWSAREHDGAWTRGILLGQVRERLGNS